MKRIYTVVIHLVFGGISSVKTFEDKGQMESAVLEWVNSNSPEWVSFDNPYEGVEWFKENSDKVQEGIVIHDEVLSALVLSDPLHKRIREYCEEMAVGLYVPTEERPKYDDLMDADDIWKIAQIWEPFAHRNDSSIKDLVCDEADRLEAFAKEVIKEMSVAELLEEIARRAVQHGIVETSGNVRLLAIRGMSDTEKDILEEEEGLWAIGFDEVIVKTENCTVDGHIKKMGEFGINYVHGV